MKVKRQHVVVHCAVCDRTLLLGEQATRFRDGAGVHEVCALCADEAVARGWLRDGAPAPPPLAGAHRRPGLLDRLRGRRGHADPRGDRLERPAPLAPAPRETSGVVRVRPTEERTRARDEQRAEAALHAVVDSVEAFNDSAYRRTVSGISKSLGRPRVSVVPLGGIRPDVVVTVAWDLSWYQYRVDPTTAPPVRLEGRGDDVAELDPRWRAWNARTADDGSLVLA